MSVDSYGNVLYYHVDPTFSLGISMITLFAHVGNLDTYIFLSFYFSVSHVYCLMVPLQKMKEGRGGYAYMNEV